jgi:hypothetical protein
VEAVEELIQDEVVVVVAAVCAHLGGDLDGERVFGAWQLGQRRADVVARAAGVEVPRGREGRPAVVERDDAAEGGDGARVGEAAAAEDAERELADANAATTCSAPAARCS